MELKLLKGMRRNNREIKKLIIIIGLTILNQFCYSQGSGSVNNSAINITLPTLSPQSPNTASLGKYGEVEVNQSTGLISPSIPLFEYNAGKMNIPISLQYSGNGVQVNQDPTWAGINWNLSGIGIITRVVNDEIDELTSPTNRKYFSQQELNDLPGKSQMLEGGSLLFDSSTVWYNTVFGFTANNIDTEADIFNYSFFGFSGSFYLDKNNIVHLIKYDKELEIQFILLGNNKSQFSIKSPNGDYYYFGGSNASESSRTWASVGAGSTLQSDYAQNAFYLYQISFNKGGAVYFDFESYASTCGNNKIGISETATLKTPTNCERQTLEIFSQVENFVKLKKIRNSFNNQIVEFQTNVKNQCAGIYQLEKVFLNSITNNLTTNLKHCDLSYFSLNNESEISRNKFFLQKVEFFDANNQLLNDFKLTYNSPELLPKKYSFAQDELGYFNGKTNNLTLLPYLSENPLYPSAYFSKESPYCGQLADREASFNFAQIGSLSKIQYPTGGFSEFEYELPYKGKKIDYATHFVNTIAAPVGSGYTSSPSYPEGSSMRNYYTEFQPFLGDGDEQLVVGNNVRIKAELNATLIGTFTIQNKIAIYVTKLGGVFPEVLIGEYGNFPTEGGSTSITFDKILEPGSYKFKLMIKKHSSGSNNIILASVSLKLPNGFRDEFHAGMRIKKTKSFVNNNDLNPEITRYYYNDIQNLLKESYFFSPNYVASFYGLNPFGAITDPLREYQQLNTNSTRDNFVNNNFIYENITISYGGDNFEKGGKGISFYGYAERSSDFYDLGGLPQLPQYNFTAFVNVSSTSISYLNGSLKSESFYNKDKFKLKTTLFNYETILDNTIHNIKTYSFGPRNMFVDDFVYLLYQKKSFKSRLISTTTKDFFNDTILSEISSTTTNTFSNDKVSLPSSIETTNSKNQTTKTNLFYKSDVNLLLPEYGGLTQLDINYMPTSEIVKTENFINNELVDTKQISFKKFSSNILPNIIRAKKGSDVSTNLEDRIVFGDYDFYGNPTLVSNKDGGKIKYVYNGKQQVILKIEENTSGVIIDDSISSTSPCYFQETYPSAMITVYNYDPISNNLMSIIDPKCDKITYEYDTFGRLEKVKDKNGKILSENEYHYKN